MSEQSKNLTYMGVVKKGVDNIEANILEMRQSQDIRTIPVDLTDYIYKKFREIEEDKENLKFAANYALARMYNAVSFITMVDKYTRTYFSVVISFLLESIQRRGVDIFYVIDNTIPDDRFEGITHLFELCKITVVTPNKGNLSYKEVEEHLVTAMKDMVNIVYIEKDASVNYVEKVMALSNKSKEISPDSNYTVCFRNEAPIQDAPVVFISTKDKKKTG